MELDFEDEDYEQIRERNIKEIESLLAQWQGDINESAENINQHIASTQSFKKRKIKADPTYKFSGVLPLERRRSDRLLSTSPIYSPKDVVDDLDSENKKNHSFNVFNLGKVECTKIYGFNRKTIGPVSTPVEEITETYLEKIARRVNTKVYSSEHGTSCHQCRQKTLDSKTYCRSPHCVGVRGQFCGVCLKNRYGEDAKKALLNPKWECPPCRGLCNCSICRTRKGKRPTGVLAPIAFQHGQKSVKDFLLSLNGVGDYIVEASGKEQKSKAFKHNHRKYNEDSLMNYLIGFNEDMKPVWVSKNKSLTFSDDKCCLVGFNKDKEPVMVAI